jgi:hypothetical protein
MNTTDKVDPVQTVRKVTGRGNSKAIAEACHVSQSTVNKWGETGEQHRTNPLELFLNLYRSTQDRRLVDCVCRAAGGFFVTNPPATLPNNVETLHQAIDQWHRAKIRVEAVLVEIDLAGQATPKLKQRLRKRVERFKSVQEGLVLALEQERFKQRLTAWLLPLWPTAEAVLELAAVGG